MAVTGVDLARLIVSSAQLQADLKIKGAVYERSLYDTAVNQRRQQIAELIERDRIKKAEKKAKKRKNTTLAVVAVATVLTGGAAALLAAPAVAAGGALVAGATAPGFATAFAAGTGSLLAIAPVASTAAIFSTGALNALSSNFLGLGPNIFGGQQ